MIASELLRLVEYLGDKLAKLDAYAHAVNQLVHEIHAPVARDRRGLDRLVHLLADISDVAALTVDEYQMRLAAVLAPRGRRRLK